jgi:hypothetical protein
MVRDGNPESSIDQSVAQQTFLVFTTIVRHSDYQYPIVAHELSERLQHADWIEHVFQNVSKPHDIAPPESFDSRVVKMSP